VRHPNIVFVLTDDLSWNLVRYIPAVRQMQRKGVTFSNYFVTDSLCCPSRSSIFTGRYPHDTGIFSNQSPDGGFQLFHDRGEESSTFATALQAVGYRTAMMGKYLNDYRPADTQGGTLPYVPPGWNEWDVADNGYPEFDYVLNRNHVLASYGNLPRDYLTDVIGARGRSFIRHAVGARRPFMLELATFAPHQPFTPAPRDAGRFPDLGAPHTPAFDQANLNAPTWLAGHPPLTFAQRVTLNRQFRRRAQSVQAVNHMIRRIQATLNQVGVAKNTIIVFSSDNGLHMGEHRLLAGKLTAFDTDIRVPLIVTGPGIPAGRTVNRLTENIDLAPTFTALANTQAPTGSEGLSLTPLLSGQKISGLQWRSEALIEHHGRDTSPADPDRPPEGSGNPTSYEAIRTPSAVYVEYTDGESEYYNLKRDPFELDNTATALTPDRRSRLHAKLLALKNCHNFSSCRKAGH